MAPKQLIVYDFDWSMADQDTDRWIFEVLAPDLRRQMKTLKDDIQWTDLIARNLKEIHTRGETREAIENALKIMPFHPAMVRGVKDLKAAKAAETTFLCLSNSNSVFISTILEGHQDKGLQNLFTEVITNPAKWEPSGMLNLRRRVDPFGPQHKCKVGCSPNMCKGEELEAFLAKQSYTYDRIIFVGDGSNDFCPILQLRDKDLCLCRSFRGLQKRIEKEGEQQGLKCKIQYWAGAWEVEEIFQNLPKIPT